mgnify:CR=1 FL=1
MVVVVVEVVMVATSAAMLVTEAPMDIKVGLLAVPVRVSAGWVRLVDARLVGLEPLKIMVPAVMADPTMMSILL